LWLGAFDKLRDFAAFEGVVAGYRLLPSVLHRPFAAAFVGAEVAAGALLLAPDWRAAGAVLTLAVLLVATLGVAINLLRGNTDIDCGCGGLANASGGLSWWLVARNGLPLLLAAMVLASAGQASRDLVWLDGVTFFGAALAVLGLYF